MNDRSLITTGVIALTGLGLSPRRLAATWPEDKREQQRARK
jgi:hypothetical protein